LELSGDLMMVFRHAASFKIGSTLGLQFFCHTLNDMEFVDILDEANWSDREFRQRFVWMSRCLIFFPYGQMGSYWIEVYIDSSITLNARTYSAVALPFHQDENTDIKFCGTDDRAENRVVIEPGDYRLIVQERLMTQAEIDALPVSMIEADISEDANDPEFALGPRCCTFTFIPVDQPCEAEILRELPNSRIPQPLTLRN
jgi:hypothetical protein